MGRDQDAGAPLYYDFPLCRYAPYRDEAANAAYRLANGIPRWEPDPTKRKYPIRIFAFVDLGERADAISYGGRNPDAGPDVPDPGATAGLSGVSPLETWREDSRATYQCAACGLGLNTHDYLCRQCKAKRGGEHRDALRVALGVARLEKTPRETLYLTKAGLAATPAELATGDLELYKYRWWPDPVKAECQTERRRRALRAAHWRTAADLATLADQLGATNQVDPFGRAPEEEATRRDLRQDLWRGVAVLPEGERALFLRYAMMRKEYTAPEKGYNHAEIAAVLGFVGRDGRPSEQMARQWWSRRQRQVRQALAKQMA
jgi:hypothetical protein